MSAGGGAMVRVSALTSNKGAPADESNFTHTGDTLNYPTDFNETYNNAKKAVKMIDKGELDGETVESVDWPKPIKFQDTYKRITPEVQAVTSSYLTGGTVLEFNITVLDTKYIRPGDMELVLPIRFRQEQNDERINLSRFIPVNNFFGHFLETVTVSREEDLETFVHPLPSGSVASYMRKILKDMSKKQLKYLEIDLLFDASEIVAAQGVDHADNPGYHLPNLAVDPDPAAPAGKVADEQCTRYRFLEERRNKFATLNEGNNGVYGDGVAIHPDNLIWQDVRYVIPMRLLSDVFNIITEVRADLGIKFNLEQDVKRLFECILPNDPVLNNNPRRTKPIFFEAPKMLYNTYVFTPRQQTHTQLCNEENKREKNRSSAVVPSKIKRNQIE